MPRAGFKVRTVGAMWRCIFPLWPPRFVRLWRAGTGKGASGMSRLAFLSSMAMTVGTSVPVRRTVGRPRVWSLTSPFGVFLISVSSISSRWLVIPVFASMFTAVFVPLSNSVILFVSSSMPPRPVSFCWRGATSSSFSMWTIAIFSISSPVVSWSPQFTPIIRSFGRTVCWCWSQSTWSTRGLIS